MKSYVLLWANGRTGNSQDMGLEALGLDANQELLPGVGDFHGEGLSPDQQDIALDFCGDAALGGDAKPGGLSGDG